MKRLGYALAGLVTLLKKDKKFVMHIMIAIVVCAAGWYLGLSRTEWLFIIISICLVLAFEALNTAVEYAVDLITEDYHLLAKYAKDIAAFSVLIVAIMTAIIGLIIFIPKLI